MQYIEKKKFGKQIYSEILKMSVCLPIVLQNIFAKADVIHLIVYCFSQCVTLACFD
jgi:hypothetical protein